MAMAAVASCGGRCRGSSLLRSTFFLGALFGTRHRRHRSRAHPDHCRSYICLAAMSACVQPTRSPRASSRLARTKAFLKAACARAWARATELGVGWRSSCAPMDCRAKGPASGLLADCRRPCSNCAIALLQGPACNEVVLRHKTATTRAGVRLTTSPPGPNASPCSAPLTWFRDRQCQAERCPSSRSSC